MSSNKYLQYQQARLSAAPSGQYDTIPLKPGSTRHLLDLPEYLLFNILQLSLPDPHPNLDSKIFNVSDMIRKTLAPRPKPLFLTLCKRLYNYTLPVWLNSRFSHIYINSWDALPSGLLAAVPQMHFVALTLDIRRGHNVEEKLVPSALCAKIKALVAVMTEVQVLLVRVWHGIRSSGPVSEIVMNSFQGLKVGEAANIVSVVNGIDGLDHLMGCPGLLSEEYMQMWLAHVMGIKTGKIPRPKTLFLDEEKPGVKVPFWRACVAAHPDVGLDRLLPEDGFQDAELEEKLCEEAVKAVKKKKGRGASKKKKQVKKQLGEEKEAENKKES